jgi:DNA polymerase III epsilon subunit-like protein
MSVLLIDFEATGIDTKTSRITEIGAMLVDDKWQPLAEFANNPGDRVDTLVWDSSYPALTPEVIEITKITQEMLTHNGRTPLEAFDLLGNLGAQQPKYVVAFNRGYDENLFRAELTRLAKVDGGLTWLTTTPWICAMVDIETNYKFKSWRLMHLALEYGVTVNPKELHRAINDVELMRRLLEASGTTPDTMYEYQIEPWVYVRAMCAKPWEDNGKSTTEAKARGYGWEQCKGDESGKRFEKCWVKRIKQRDVAKEEQATFPVRVITT